MLDNPVIGSCFSTFEECSGLEESFSDGLKEVEVEALVIIDIISDSGQKDLIEKPLGHRLL